MDAASTEGQGRAASTPITRRNLLGGVGAGALLAVSGKVAGPWSSVTRQAKPSLRVGFAYEGVVTDDGWTFTFDKARKQMIAALSSVAAVKTTYVENVPYTQESEEIFSDLASKNELVIVNGEYASFLSIVAKRFPHVKFLECGGHTYLPNEFPFYVSNWYPAYDLGVAAGLLTKSGKLGYIGAFPSAYQYDDLNGLLIGARTVNPKATVACVYISSYFDPTKATTAANALIDNGAEFLFSIEDEPSFLEVANRRGVWCAYWNTSVPQFAPHTYVNSYDLEWGPFFTEEARKVLEGTWIAEKQIHLLPVNLGAWGAHVPDSVKNRVASIRKKYPLGYNFYKGPMDNDHGKQVLARGQSLTPSQAYVIDWVVEGVKGSGV